MDTPICDFVRHYAQSGARRLHMPGHKGTGPLGVEMLDITEISGADVLYHANGIIRRSQENAAALFGAAKTLYSAEGSSLAIRAMLALVTMQTGGPVRIVAGRNAHKVFMTACALLDIDVDWLCPDGALLSCEISPEYLNSYLSKQAEKPAAVYITSPDYLGNVADIAGISAVCRKYGLLLLADNAHGAYLRFLPESRHPMDLGADLCCDSAHKTLPVLTGGAYLHISSSAPEALRDGAEKAMALFASTSPSYLILQSLDAANRYLEEGYRQRLAAFAAEVSALRERLNAAGFELLGNEPLKLTVYAKSYGYTGTEMSDVLEEKGLICEFSDPDHVVCMLTPENGMGTLAALESALTAMPRKEPLPAADLPGSIPERRCSVRQALLGPRQTLPLDQCRGRILAEAAVSCPPAVPVAICGEVLDDAALTRMCYYGITACDVVCE